MRRSHRIFSVLFFCSLAIATARAQVVTQPMTRVPSEEKNFDFSDSARVEALKADFQQREALAEELVAAKESPGREFPAEYRGAMIRALKLESGEQLRERRISGNINSMALGDSKKDLVYTPLEPCRLFDTRLMPTPPHSPFGTVGDPLVAGGPGPLRHFNIAGTNGFSDQGGNAGGCGVPITATSVLINFVAVNPQGQGNLRGSAFPTPLTIGGILTYQALNPPLNITNGLLFPICDPLTTPNPPGCEHDISLSATGASTHVVGTVLGYAIRFPKEQVRSNVTQAFNLATTFIINGGSCVQYENSGITVTAPPGVAGTVWFDATVMLKVTHTGGYHDLYNVFI